MFSSSSIPGISDKDVDITMWGYSGGSIATEWATELHSSYAPELNIAGATIGGIVTNLNNTIISMNKSKYAGLGVAGLWGLYQAYSEMKDPLDDELYPENRTKLENPRTQCAGADFDQFDGENIFDYFKSDEAVLNKQPLKDIIEKTGIMGKHSVPKIPLYFYKAKGDIVNPIEDTDNLVKHVCDQGIGSLEYVRNSQGDHTSDRVWGRVVL